MRRRSRMKALKNLQLYQGRIVVCLILVFHSYTLCEPGYLDFDNLPETNFTCAGKVIGGYYADLETSCQMFHVCTIGQLDEPMDIKFLCLNGTVFDQETRVCERVDEVDCTKSEKFYYLNLELYGNTMLPLPEEESSEENQSATPSSTSTTTTAPTTATVATSNKIAPTASTSDTTTRKEHHSTPSAYQPPLTSLETPSGIVSATASGAKKQSATPPVTTISTPTQYLSSKQKPFDSDELLDDDEYEYEDDYFTTNGKELQNYQNQNIQKTTATSQEEDLGQKIFSPQQFILNQNSEKESTQTLIKPAISFQQQQFQNGGTLTVTNSHVTSKSWPQLKPQQIVPSPTPSISPKKNTYSLLPTSLSSSSLDGQQQQQQQQHSAAADLSYLQSFRIQGQGFRLPSVHLSANNEQQHILQQQQHELLQKQLQPHSSPFEGYRKHMPQITLRLPIEGSRSHKEILGFDSLDEEFPPEEHKELKRSDAIPPTTATKPSTPQMNYGQRNINSNNHHNNNNNNSSNLNHMMESSNGAPSHIAYPHYENHRSVHHQHHEHHHDQQHENGDDQQNQNQQQQQSSQEANSNYDKVLLTPQDQYIPTLPKVIISASASVTDASGKMLNYSVGNVIASTNIKSPPLTYDEYREDDVSLDPFFLDVPKIAPRRGKRNVIEKVIQTAAAITMNSDRKRN